MLKKFKILIVYLLLPLIAFLQITPNELLAKIENALGGKAALQNIQTLQYKSSLQVNLMGQSLTIGINNIKENGKLCRRETDGVFGMKGSVLLLTDTGMYTAVPDMSNFGEARNAVNKIEQATPKEFLLSKYLLETQGYFAPLVDCYSKGNKFEILETKKINGVECIKTTLTLISKQKIVYYINNTSFLIEQAEIEGESAMVYLGLGGMMKNLMSRMDKLKLVISYSNYKKFGEVYFPTKEIIAVGANDFLQETEEFIINAAISQNQFVLKQ
jgi:hypothetical protein